MTMAAAVVVIGIGTYLIRLSFIGAFGSRAMPSWLERPLRYVAPAVLAAILVPAVVLGESGLDLRLASNPRVLAATIAAVVAWRTRNIAAVIVVGMGTLWVLQAVL